jgi:hypothetical protein
MQVTGTRKNKLKNNNITVVKKMKDYSTEKAFIKKAENAIAFIEKHGLPKSSKEIAH